MQHETSCVWPAPPEVISCGSATTGPSSEQRQGSAAGGLISQSQQATGSGQVAVGGALRTFAFTAVPHPDGTVTGEAQLFNRIGGFIAHARIICLTVIGNHAWMGGIIVHSDVPQCAGTNMMFHAQDNGERSHDPPDLLSFAEVCDVPGPALPLEYCATAGGADQIPTFPVEKGNIQIHQ